MHLTHPDLCSWLSILSGTNQGLFNNAAQSWNHAFYWDCMKANGGGVATGKIAAMIDAQFGSYDKFKAEFTAAGKSHLPVVEMRSLFHCEESKHNS